MQPTALMKSRAPRLMPDVSRTDPRIKGIGSGGEATRLRGDDGRELLTSRASRDVVVAGRQLITHRWWDVRRPDFDLVVSQVVLDEIRVGDPEAAARRLELVAGLPLLDVTPEVRSSAI
jgi:hypothetical protein